MGIFKYLEDYAIRRMDGKDADFSVELNAIELIKEAMKNQRYLYNQAPAFNQTDHLVAVLNGVSDSMLSGNSGSYVKVFAHETGNSLRLNNTGNYLFVKIIGDNAELHCILSRNSGSHVLIEADNVTRKTLASLNRGDYLEVYIKEEGRGSSVLEGNTGNNVVLHVENFETGKVENVIIAGGSLGFGDLDAKSSSTFCCNSGDNAKAEIASYISGEIFAQNYGMDAQLKIKNAKRVVAFSHNAGTASIFLNSNGSYDIGSGNRGIVYVESDSNDASIGGENYVLGDGIYMLGKGVSLDWSKIKIEEGAVPVVIEYAGDKYNMDNASDNIVHIVLKGEWHNAKQFMHDLYKEISKAYIKRNSEYPWGGMQSSSLYFRHTYKTEKGTYTIDAGAYQKKQSIIKLIRKFFGKKMPVSSLAVKQ